MRSLILSLAMVFFCFVSSVYAGESIQASWIKNVNDKASFTACQYTDWSAAKRAVAAQGMEAQLPYLELNERNYELNHFCASKAREMKKFSTK